MVVVGSPVLLLGPMALILLLWVALLAAGLDHFPQGMNSLLAMPPFSSLVDFQLAFTLTGRLEVSLLWTLAFTVARAIVFAILVSLVLDAVQTGRVSARGLRRGIAVAPTFFVLMLAFAGLLIFSQIAQRLLGSLGGLIFLAALVGGVAFLAFAPVVVVANGVPALEAMRRSIRAARLPGARHVSMVALYVFLLVFFAYAPAGAAFTVNPSAGIWGYVLAFTVIHVVFLAAFAYRYLHVEPEIPAPGSRARLKTPRLLGR
jgi:hypothetical protein